MNKISHSFRADKRANRAQRHRGRSQLHIYYGTDATSTKAIQAGAEATDAITAEDREWFVANPGRCYRLRLSSDPERAISGACNYIVVKQIRPGVRVRVGIKAHPFHHPENFSDNACARLFAEAEKMSPPDLVKALKTMERV